MKRLHIEEEAAGFGYFETAPQEIQQRAAASTGCGAVVEARVRAGSHVFPGVMGCGTAVKSACFGN